MESSIDYRPILKQFGLLFAIIILMLVLTGLSPQFLAIRNILNLLMQASVNAIIAAGMTKVILTSGIDLSVGSVLALTAVVTASILQMGVPVPIAIILGLLLGAALGMLNGALVALLNIPPFIATLGTMTLTRGLALSYSGGRPVTGLPTGFLTIGTSSLLGIPLPIWITLAVFLTGSFILNKTMFGRYIFALGNNAEAARFAGLPVRTTIIMVYAISGLLAALAGMILVARLDSAQPIMGIAYEMNAIAAVVVGGAALSGGEGNLSSTFQGALLMAIIANAINILDISPFFSQILQGGIILSALLLHGLSRSRSN